MAFENLEPFREQLIALRADGKKLHELVEYLLENHSVRTTTGTLSRYFQHVAPNAALRDPRPEEKQLTDVLLMQMEILGEIRGRGDEVRLAVEHHAGQIRVLTEEIESLRADLTKRNKQQSSATSAEGTKPGFFGLFAVAALGAVVGAALLYAGMTLG